MKNIFIVKFLEIVIKCIINKVYLWKVLIVKNWNIVLYMISLKFVFRYLVIVEKINVLFLVFFDDVVCDLRLLLRM